MGGFIADLFVQTIIEGLVAGTGALVLRTIRPTKAVDETAALLLGLVVWLAIIAALFTIGYLLLA